MLNIKFRVSIVASFLHCLRASEMKSDFMEAIDVGSGEVEKPRMVQEEGS